MTRDNLSETSGMLLMVWCAAIGAAVGAFAGSSSATRGLGGVLGAMLGAVVGVGLMTLWYMLPHADREHWDCYANPTDDGFVFLLEALLGTAGVQNPRCIVRVNEAEAVASFPSSFSGGGRTIATTARYPQDFVGSVPSAEVFYDVEWRGQPLDGSKEYRLIRKPVEVRRDPANYFDLK